MKWLTTGYIFPFIFCDARYPSGQVNLCLTQNAFSSSCVTAAVSNKKSTLFLWLFLNKLRALLHQFYNKNTSMSNSNHIQSYICLQPSESQVSSLGSPHQQHIISLRRAGAPPRSASALSRSHRILKHLWLSVFVLRQVGGGIMGNHRMRAEMTVTSRTALRNAKTWNPSWKFHYSKITEHMFLFPIMYTLCQSSFMFVYIYLFIFLGGWGCWRNQPAPAWFCWKIWTAADTATVRLLKQLIRKPTWNPRQSNTGVSLEAARDDWSLIGSN